MIEYIAVALLAIFVGYLAVSIRKKDKERIYIHEDYNYHIRIEEIKPENSSIYFVVNAKLIDRCTGADFRKNYYSKVGQDQRGFVEQIINDYKMSNEYLRATKEMDANE